MSNLVENIKNICQIRGKTIPELAAACGISAPTIYRWSNSSPSVDKILKVSNELNVPIEALLCDNMADSSITDQLLDKLCLQTTNNDITWEVIRAGLDYDSICSEPILCARALPNGEIFDPDDYYPAKPSVYRIPFKNGYIYVVHQEESSDGSDNYDREYYYFAIDYGRHLANLTPCDENKIQRLCKDVEYQIYTKPHLEKQSAFIMDYLNE